MKAQILKIAGVKSEKEFYKKFPTEAAFKKAHGKELKKAQLGASMAPEVGSYIGGQMGSNPFVNYDNLYDNTDLSITGMNDEKRMRKASLQAQQSQAQAAQKQANKKGLMDALSAGMGKNGKKLKKAQGGRYMPDPIPYGGSPAQGGQITQAGADAATAGAKEAANWSGNPSPMGAYIGAGQDIIQGISMLKGEKDAYNLAKQSKLVSDVSLQAAATRPEQMQRKYVRPEDVAFGTQEMGSAYGVGTNYLARHGSVIAGNPTEIQNTYAPYNTLYSDLGYEPLEDSDQVKQYRAGGMMAQDGWTTRAANAEFSCAANPRDQLRQIKASTSGGTSDPLHDIKSEYWDKIKDQWESQGVNKKSFNSMYEDSLRAGPAFENPLSSQSFDPVTGKARPGTTGRLKYYKEAGLPLGTRPTLEQIKKIALDQPGGMKSYDKLVKEDYPWGSSPFIPQNKEGGIIEAQQGFNWKGFAGGGGSDIAGDLGQYVGSGKPGPNAGSSIGRGAGSAIGTAFGGPVGGMIGGFLGGTVGGLIDGKPRKTAKYNAQTQSNVGNIAFGKGVQGLQQGQYSAFMEDGGWVSNDWQPQVIAKFGDHTAEDYYNAGHEGMDSLRSGGHLSGDYTPPSERAMQTYALGGQLKTLWGGHAEPISQNPYLPGTGETVMFRGKSHDDGGIGVSYGNKGEDSYTDYAEYGTEAAMDEADVEVEGGEPMVELEEGGQVDPITGEAQKAGVVYGDLVLNKQMAKDHNFGKEAGRKMKHIVKDWSKGEAKQNKIIEKSLEIIDNHDDTTAFDQLAFSTAKAMNQGANMKLKKYADDKIVLAGIQSALNDTAKEYGVVASDLAKGKITKDKSNNNMAKFGKSLTKAQSGISNFVQKPEIVNNFKYPWMKIPHVYANFPQSAYPTIPNPLPDYIPGSRKIPSLATPPYVSNKKGGSKKSDKVEDPKYIGRGEWREDPDDAAIYSKPRSEYFRSPSLTREEVTKMMSDDVKSLPNTSLEKKSKPKKDFGKAAMIAYNEILPYLRPKYKVGQPDFMAEMLAASMNQLEPVQAQLFTPSLAQPYDVSFQDRLNANQADFNALQRTTGYNPAASSALAAQKYAANNAILAEQFRANQGEKARVYEKNREIMDQANLANLGILDKQYERQAQAKSKTKAQAIEITKSISDKLAQQRKEQAISNIEQQRYNYRFDANGRPINMNPLAMFNMSGSKYNYGNKGGIPGMGDDWMTLYDENGKFQGTKRKTKKDDDDSGKNGTKIKARNGSIVKAIKNL